MLSDKDMPFLRRCVVLAREALEAGNSPFGSVLADATGKILKEDQNRTVTETNISLHPEFTLAVWAQKNLTPTERASATVYTSGEHCPMCSTAHAFAGLGRIVYAASASQYVQWKAELGAKPGPVVMQPIHQIAPGLPVDGPAPDLADEIYELHRLKYVQETS
ncbi:cytidine deaminase-like protein [Thelonectria olida]|uniref:Cytidine deaminase-like protein n=1 Tax=Thelonectria olida TaxID=1576542 RepID=A0A9P8WA07_9HYPO|nr:cytidine deaminase-like protein [Thelonectria olida]